MTALLAASGAGYEVAGRALLSGIDLAFPQRSLSAIIGPNGSGKTTLLRLLAGVRAPARGRVLLAGKPLASFRRAEVASRLSYVPQNTWTDFEITVFDAVAMGRLPSVGAWRALSRADFDAIHRALERLDLQDLRERTLPTLSAGERQRVFIARALAQGADVLLLDEPTSSLDIGHQLGLMAILEELNAEGKTIVAAMHDLGLVWSTFPRAVLLHHGQKAGDGETREVLLGAAAAAAFAVRLSAGADGRLLAER